MNAPAARASSTLAAVHPSPVPTDAPLRRWGAHLGGFFFTTIEICLLGALLGALAFRGFGRLGGVPLSAAELIVRGVKTGSFFFLVWAPGFALVRAFIRARRPRPSPQIEWAWTIFGLVVLATLIGGGLAYRR